MLLQLINMNVGKTATGQAELNLCLWNSFCIQSMYLVCRLNGEEFSFKIHSGCWQNSLQLSVWEAKLLPAATSRYPVSKVRPTVFYMISHMTTWFTEWSRTVSEESASKTFFTLRYGLEVRWRPVYKGRDFVRNYRYQEGTDSKESAA